MLMAVEIPPNLQGYVMENGNVTYQNRSVPRNGFRVFIYAKNGDKKLVNSWEEFKRCIDSNEWFSTEAEAKYALQEENKPEMFSIDELKEAEKIANVTPSVLDRLLNDKDSKNGNRKHKKERR